MIDGPLTESPVEVGFLLLPNFSMGGFVSAVEPLRLANWVSDRDLYRWRLFSRDGQPVTGSNGIAIQVDAAIADVETYPTVFVCGGLDVHRYDHEKVLAWLRRLARRGANLGALCTGSYALARAGLLDGYRCTIHWENLPAFSEQFPDLDVTNELFEIDRGRLTCAGGTAALDMMLHIIAQQFGREVEMAVSEELIYSNIRESTEIQRMAMPVRFGITHSKLLKVIAAMEENLEKPLSQREMADEVGLSTRQLERLFRKYLQRTPTRFYLELRLKRARQLLLQTSMSVLDVALACGFVSASHFSKCYRDQFGCTPRDQRRALV